jgi:hypothetical protein
MAQPTTNKPTNKPTATPPPAKATSNGSAPEKTKKKVKRPKVRFHSSKEPTYWVRAYKDVTDKFGPPTDPWGNKMEPRAAVAFGISPEERAAKKAAKEAEKLRFESMSVEDKLAFAKTKRDAKQAKKEAKKAAEKEQLIAQIKREIAEGKL